MILIDVSTKMHPGFFASISDCDFEIIGRYKWSVFLMVKNCMCATEEEATQSFIYIEPS